METEGSRMGGEMIQNQKWGRERVLIPSIHCDAQKFRAPNSADVVLPG